MTSAELITSIEAGETGPELLCAIARTAGVEIPERDWTFRLPAYTTSIDAAVTLLAGCG